MLERFADVILVLGFVLITPFVIGTVYTLAEYDTNNLKDMYKENPVAMWFITAIYALSFVSWSFIAYMHVMYGYL